MPYSNSCHECLEKQLNVHARYFNIMNFNMYSLWTSKQKNPINIRSIPVLLLNHIIKSTTNFIEKDR